MSAFKFLSSHTCAFVGRLVRIVPQEDELLFCFYLLRRQPTQHPLAHLSILEGVPAVALGKVVEQYSLEPTECALALDGAPERFLEVDVRDRLNKGFHIGIAFNGIG